MQRGMKSLESTYREVMRKLIILSHMSCAKLRCSDCLYKDTNLSTVLAKSTITVWWIFALHSIALSWPLMAVNAVLLVCVPLPESRHGGGLTLRAHCCLLLVRSRLEGN